MQRAGCKFQQSLPKFKDNYLCDNYHSGGEIKMNCKGFFFKKSCISHSSLCIFIATFTHVGNTPCSSDHNIVWRVETGDLTDTAYGKSADSKLSLYDGQSYSSVETQRKRCRSRLAADAGPGGVLSA